MTNCIFLKVSDPLMYFSLMKDHIPLSVDMTATSVSKKIKWPCIFLRYVREAECYCAMCQKAKSLNCMKLSYEIKVFRHKGCGDDGLAIMTQESLNVTVGCYCMNGVPQDATPRPKYDDVQLS